MKRNLLLLTLLASLLACSKQELSLTVPEETAAPSQAGGAAEMFFSEELAALVEEDLQAGKLVTRSMGLNQALDELGITSYERIFPDAGEFEERSRKAGLHRWYRVTYSDAQPVTRALDNLRAVDGVLAANPVRRVKVNDTFNDPSFGDQWQFSGNNGINVGRMWKDVSKGSDNVIVAIVDLGVDLYHEDLAANCIPDKGAGSYNFVGGNPTVVPGAHGTHCAGIVSAVNNNGIGVSSVAGGDAAAGIGGVRILGLEIAETYVNDKGESSQKWADGATAIKYAADHGAVICSNSWGYVYEKADGSYDYDSAKTDQEFFLQPNEGEYSSSLKSAIDYFIEYAGTDAYGNQTGPMKGGLVVFAAGNDGQSFGPPACYPPIVAVGATASDGMRASYSNFGDWVDIAAPGSSILSTIPDDKYGYMNGTSMACPMVSGVAALVVSALQGEGFTSEELRSRLIDGADYSHFGSNRIIGPFVDPLGSVSLYSTSAPAALADFTAEVSSNDINLSWKVTAEENGTASYGTLIIYGTDKDAVSAADPSSPGNKVKTRRVLTGDLEEGDTATAGISGLDFETTYYFTLVPYAYRTNFAAKSPVKSVVTAANRAPVITPKGNYKNLALKASEVVEIDFEFSEPDGHEFTVGHESGSAAESWGKNLNARNTYTLKIVSANAEPGTYKSLITATDAYGLTATFELEYTLLENHAPVVSRALDNILMSGTGGTEAIKLSDYFSDPDGDALVYTLANSGSSAVHSVVSEGVLHITSLGYGLAAIDVTASDPRGASVSGGLKVLVRQQGTDISVYPNPVSTTLYVGTGEDEGQASVLVASSTGSVVYSGTTTASAFNPVTVDMSACAPGTYSVSVKYGSVSATQTVIKQ